MPFTPSNDPVPPGFQAGPYVLEPIGPHLAEPDLEAVLASREMLRRWSASTWPEDDFSLDANAADLADHADDHAKRLAFGYSVREVGTGRVFGSVYVIPVSDYLDRWRMHDGARDRLMGWRIAVDWWFRSDEVERWPAFFDALNTWMESAWPGPVLYGSRPGMIDLRAIYLTRGLVEIAVITSPGGTVQHLHGR